MELLHVLVPALARVNVFSLALVNQNAAHVDAAQSNLAQLTI